MMLSNPASAKQVSNRKQVGLSPGDSCLFDWLKSLLVEDEGRVLRAARALAVASDRQHFAIG